MALNTQVANANRSQSFLHNSGRHSPNPLTHQAGAGPEIVTSDGGYLGTSSPLDGASNRSRSSTSEEPRPGRDRASTSEFVNDEQLKLDRLRKQLRFFFMNPWEKWKARRQFPWKLFLQILKIILVTTQLFFFGATRLSRIGYNDQTRKMLSHLFFKEWDTTMDVYVYPPPAGPFSVHTKDKVFENLSHAVKRYYTIRESSMAPLDYNFENSSTEIIPPMKFCVTSYDSFEYFAGNKSFDVDTHMSEDCLWIALDNKTMIEMMNDSMFMRAYLREQGFQIRTEALFEMDLFFDLTVLHLQKTVPSDGPECFHLKTKMIWDNSDQTGTIKQSLEVDPLYFTCTSVSGKSQKALFSSTSGVVKGLVIFLDITVVCVCVASLLLCGRALVKGFLLKRKTERMLEECTGLSLPTHDKVDFFNLWYVMIVVNDSCIVLGTIFKLGIEFSEKNYASGLFTATGMLLGIGDFLVWCGVLRYLGFFSHYNILIITMKKSLPNVIRFMVCAGILYFGFLFCGWLVLGPYSLKFHDIKRASECLFSLINGDDMFATFYTIDDRNTAVKWFGRIYLYLFIAMFIYIVLSLFISIIMDAYEVVKERIEGDVTGVESPLHRFISECVDTPRPGNFEPDSLTDVCRCSAGWCWNCLKRRKHSLRTRRRRNSYQSIGDERSESESDTEYGMSAS